MERMYISEIFKRLRLTKDVVDKLGGVKEVQKIINKILFDLLDREMENGRLVDLKGHMKLAEDYEIFKKRCLKEIRADRLTNMDVPLWDMECFLEDNFEWEKADLANTVVAEFEKIREGRERPETAEHLSGGEHRQKS